MGQEDITIVTVVFLEQYVSAITIISRSGYAQA
jgi:hypothetical protein